VTPIALVKRLALIDYSFSFLFSFLGIVSHTYEIAFIGY
jgi:hypothetical protein